MRNILILTGIIMILPITLVYGQIEPDPSQPIGPVTNVGLEYKFDPGFYDKILDIMDDPIIEGDPGIFDGTRYYDTILVISRGGIDGDATAKQNKESLLIKLNEIGARDIYVAEVLSFITASIPVGDVPGISIHDEVYALGDGEEVFKVELDSTLITLNAKSRTINNIQPGLNGSGVTVSVIDTGINHVSLNDKVIKRNYCPDGNCFIGTDLQSTNNMNLGILNNNTVTHGTKVAQIIASTGLIKSNGLAPGVNLLDAMWGYEYFADDGEIYTQIYSKYFINAIDWSHKNGADVINLSAGSGFCNVLDVTTYNLIVNESVDKGVVFVKSAGNSGYDKNTNRNVYNSITNPGCAENVITVGGIDRSIFYQTTIDKKSSRGPTINHMLKPDLSGVSVNLSLLDSKSPDKTDLNTGTSIAAPQVTSAVALMLQLDPTLTPAEVKSLLLLSADWKGPESCSSIQYETSTNRNDMCSFGYQPSSVSLSRRLDVLNNIGHGVLDIGQTLQYIKNGKHLIYDYLDTSTSSKNYTINIKNIKDPTKILLTWLVHPHGSIKDQVERDNVVPVSNLDFTIQCKDGTNHTVNSVNQTVEFIVFQPTSKGKCTITVSGTGLDDINKPVQNFALSSTAPFKQKGEKDKDIVGIYDTFHVSKETYTPIQLTSFYDGNDILQYRITKEPTQGTLSAIEFITNNRSRVTYTPNYDFTGNDSFQFQAFTDNMQGEIGTITLLPENLPPHTEIKDILYNNLHDMFIMTPIYNNDNNQYVHTDLIHINYDVESILVESNNVDNAIIKISANNSEIYRMVIPHDDTRMITFDNPMLITNIELVYEWLDESELGITEINNMNAIVGTIGVNMNNKTTSLNMFKQSNDKIYDLQHKDSITIKQSGYTEHAIVNFNITHDNINELKVTLRTPANKDIILVHESNNIDDISTLGEIQTSFDITGNTINHNIKGTWSLIIEDLRYNDFNGTLHNWSLNLVHKPDIIDINPIDGNVLFHETFDNLDRWTQTGNGMSIVNKFDDRHKTFALHNKTNNFLQIDPCEECKLTLKNGLDLSNYTDVMLSFWQYVPLPYDSDGMLILEIYNDYYDDYVYDYYLHESWLGLWYRDFISLNGFQIDNNNTIVFTNTITDKTSYIDDIIIFDGHIIHQADYHDAYILDRDDMVVSVFDGDLYITDINIKNITTNSRLTGIDLDDSKLYVSDTKNNKIYKYDLRTDKHEIFASTLNKPKGIEIIDDYNIEELYVATSKGIEKFGNTGKSLGLFGDAKRMGGLNNTFPMTTSDVTICEYDNSDNDKIFNLYVVDNMRDIVYYYDNNGNYLNKMKMNGDITGITCSLDYDNNINNIFLYVSINNEQQDYISKISINNHIVIENITNNINNPRGMDMGDHIHYDGKLHIINNDHYYIIDNNKITKSNKLLNKPIDVAIGHYYYNTTRSIDYKPTSEINTVENNRPKITTPKDTQIFKVLQNNTITINIQSTDQDNDSLTLSIDPDMIPPSNINLIDNGDGTGTVQINTDLPIGDYIFWVQSNDGTNDDEVQLMLEIR